MPRRRPRQALTVAKPVVVCHQPRLLVYTGGVPRAEHKPSPPEPMR